jgi:hypothetical protein
MYGGDVPSIDSHKEISTGWFSSDDQEAKLFVVGNAYHIIMHVSN